MARVLVIAILGLFAALVAVAGFLFLRGGSHGPTPQGAPTPPPAGEGWLNLLDSGHAGAWENVTDDKDIFAVEGDVLHIFGKTLLPLRYVGFTGREFGDLEMHVDFKVAAGANSGIFLLSSPGDPVNRGFEVQVLDDFGDAPTKHGCAAIYDVVTPMFNMSRPAGEWNSYDITLRDGRIIIVFNGWKVVDTDFALMTTPLGKFEAPYAQLPEAGSIMLQDHGGEVWYRNLLIRPLD